MTPRITLAALTAAAVTALAATAGPAAADTQSTTLKYTGAPQTVEVPAGASAVAITATGGSGGSNDADAASPGGKAATVTGFLHLSPDARLTVDVGAAGKLGTLHGHPTTGGWGYTHGGGGGSAQESGSAGGGGGSSAVLLDGQPIAIAGGGGGTGGIGTSWKYPGGAGGNAGATAWDGEASDIPGAGGKGGSVAGGDGTSADSCRRPAGGAGGGGGGGAATPGGGAAGGCGAFSPPVISFGGGGGGGAGSSLASDALVDPAITTAATRGDGTVTLTWFVPTACHDATQLIDSTTATHTVDLSKTCAGAAAKYALQDKTGDGKLSSLDPATGRATFTVEPGSTGIAHARMQLTDVFGNQRSFTVTLLVAPADAFALTSGGLTLDARNGEAGDYVLAEDGDGSPGQRWSLQDAGDGTVTLANAAEHNCLTTTLGRAVGTPFEVDNCRFDIPNPLRIQASQDGSGITITDVDSGLPLTFSSLAPGARLILGARDDAPTWTLAKA